MVGVSGETPMAKLLQEWGERLQHIGIKTNKRPFIQVSLPSSNVSLKLLRNCSILASKTSSLYKGEQLNNIKGLESSISTISVSVSAVNTHQHPVETGDRSNPPHHRGLNHTAASI